MFEPKYKYLLCRLCKSTKFVRNLYEIEDGTSVVEKIKQCIGLEICQNDGLPPMICKFCEKTIQKFYAFKQNCLKVNSELYQDKHLITSIKVENIQSKRELTDWLEYDSSEDINNVIKIKNETDTQKIKEQIQNKYPRNTAGSDVLDEKHVDSTVKNCNDEHSLSCIQCELCGNIYQTKTEFKTHLTSHNVPRLHQCKFCNKNFTRIESREVHIRAHLGICAFICEICGKSSTKKQDLIRHLKIHSDERNYNCPTCGRKFKRSGDLHSHRRTHTGARPYKCKNCGKGYTSNSGLRKHITSKICKELDIKNITSK